ncbi:MAG: hypothetical protein JWL61_3650 [Gemmatimonadetes bacterium]|nr:hypothetical protein [Gemmatimonadota bacterium]
MDVIRQAAVLVAATLLGACGRAKVPAADSSSASSAASASAPQATSGTCSRTGHWGDCQLRARLGESGLAPRSTSEKVGDLPSLPVKPTTLMLGNAGVAFYLFPDTLSRRHAAATLDTAKFIAQTRPVSMKAETTLIENDNVLVLLFSKNEHQRERVADAVTAGPPQP